MKNISILILVLLTFSWVKAQVSIGKNQVNGESTIMDFYDETNNFQGLILPAVENINSSLANDNSQNNGTFLFDKSDSRLKMYENNSWVELSEVGDKSNLLLNNNEENFNDTGVIIGEQESNAIGVLVVESTNKSVILPKIKSPHITVKSPYPGMMCYDLDSKSIALFDGSVWNYWK